MQNRLIITTILLLTSLLFVVGVAVAQTLPPSISSEIEAVTSQIQDLGLDELSAPSVDILLSTSGVVGTTAGLTAQTENLDNNTSLFSWYLDDQEAPVLSGKAKMSFSFRTTKQLHIVRLVISTNNTIITQSTVAISSFSVALIWHTDTLVPSDYEGKSMPIVGSRVTVIAIPNIRNEQPQDLLYTWYINSESLVRNVLGEQEFSFTITKNKSFIPIVVEVSNQQGSLRVRQAINIPILRPLILLDSNTKNIQTKIYNITTVTPGDKITVHARAFYFHAENLNNLGYSWSFLGNNALGVPPDPNVLTLTIPQNSASGRKFLRIEVVNGSVLGERAETDMEIIIL